MSSVPTHSHGTWRCVICETKHGATSQQCDHCNLSYSSSLALSLLFEHLGGSKLDIYNNQTKHWWPCQIVDLFVSASTQKIKVKYDGLAAQSDEWIDLKQDRARIAELYTHTKTHQTHQKLKNVSTKRKQEWLDSNLFDLASFHEFSHFCSYYNLCQDILAQFVQDNKINDAMFELQGNHCFCPECHEEREDQAVYARGKPSQAYVLPIGYARFGIKIPSGDDMKEDILNDWHVVYHGTKSKYIREISEGGLILLKPNDFKLTGDKGQVIAIQPGHIQSTFERVNAYTKEKEQFDPIQIFTSPSCVYAEKYCDQISINGHLVSFMFQCRQKPATYHRGQETMAYGANRIDAWIDNEEIEFYTKSNLDLIITGLLVKIHGIYSDDEESDQADEADVDEEDFKLKDEDCEDDDDQKHEEAAPEDVDYVDCVDIEDADEDDYDEESDDLDHANVEDAEQAEYNFNADEPMQEEVAAVAGICEHCDGSGRQMAGDCSQCNGNGACTVCDGSGIYANAISCELCAGTGMFDTGEECFDCSATGIYKRIEQQCRECHGEGACSKCDATGVYEVDCKHCDGTGCS